jgi:predicted type IV restriction endonuclease
VGLELKDNHVRQAVDYAANQGVDWVVLTNGITWRVYKVTFAKPIDQELVVEIDFCNVNSRTDADIEKLYLLCKEGWIKSVIGEYHIQKQMLSRFFVAAAVLSQPCLDVIRRELKRVAPDVKISTEEIDGVLTAEVLKREVLEGDKADEAKKKLSRAQNKARKAKEEQSQDSTPVEPPQPTMN